jgi:SAM-dependent methyltransferase
VKVSKVAGSATAASRSGGVCGRLGVSGVGLYSDGMTDLEHGPNAEQASYWSETSGPTWVQLQERIDGQIAPIGLAAIRRAAPKKGESCLDIGCGCGQTSLQLAERSGGRVLGVDLSAPMLERAAERAKAAGADARFERGDAQIHPFAPESVDLVFSRFGVMFYQDPVAAFANIRRALRASGRLVFACWKPPGENAWVRVPMAAAAQHVTFEAPADPTAPGPFSLADSARIESILREAGYADVAIEPLALDIEVGGGAPPDEVLDFVLQIGPTARLLADAPPEKIQAVREAVREALVPHFEDGVLRLGSATWIVSARPA